MPITVHPASGVQDEIAKLAPLGSLVPYLAPTSAAAQTTHLLQLNVAREIFVAQHSGYDAFLNLLLFKGTPIFENGVETHWDEWGNQRIPIVFDDTTSPAGTQLTAQSNASAGAYAATVTVNVTQASYDAAKINGRIYYNNGVAAVKAKTTLGGHPALTLGSAATGVNIPATLQGAKATMSAELRADGEDRIVNSQRYSTIHRSNLIPTIMNSQGYGRRMWLQMQNGGTTNFMQRSREQLIFDTKADAMVEFMIGVKGYQQQDNGKLAPACDGIQTQIINAGNTPVSTTMGNLTTIVEQAAVGSQTGGSNTKWLMGTTRLLLEVSKAYKGALTRYTPNDMAANLNLNSITMGATNVVLVANDMLGDGNYFPEEYANRLYLIDPTSIQMAGQKGMPYMDINRMVQNQLIPLWGPPQSGTMIDSVITPVEITAAPRVIWPERNTIIDVA